MLWLWHPLLIFGHQSLFGLGCSLWHQRSKALGLLIVVIAATNWIYSSIVQPSFCQDNGVETTIKFSLIDGKHRFKWRLDAACVCYILYLIGGKILKLSDEFYKRVREYRKPIEVASITKLKVMRGKIIDTPLLLTL